MMRILCQVGVTCVAVYFECVKLHDSDLNVSRDLGNTSKLSECCNASLW